MTPKEYETKTLCTAHTFNIITFWVTEKSRLFFANIFPAAEQNKRNELKKETRLILNAPAQAKENAFLKHNLRASAQKKDKTRRRQHKAKWNLYVF